MKYTVFCKQADDIGTVHIDTIEANNLRDAKIKGRINCMHDWYGLNDNVPDRRRSELRNIACIGVAEGDVKILYWGDLSE